MTDRAPTPEFDRAAYERMKLPRRLGESIAAWDGPEFVTAPVASFMRPDDHVLGIDLEGRARAYPLWLIDYYHVVNDRIDDRPFIVTSCERCGTGSAFWAEPPGTASREPLFRAGGLLNAALMLSDLRSGSHWVHYEGRGVDRRGAGVVLPWIPVTHIEWSDWCALHPDTEVWAPPEDPRHPDPRHGHGREEFFGRPGMEPALLETMTRALDDRYPENEMVLGIADGEHAAAYPLREVHRAGGVVHDELPGGRVVVFAGPRPDGITMRAFRPDLDGTRLTFERRGGAFVDAETGSRWTVEGAAVDGTLGDSRLAPIRSFFVRWHAWSGWHAGTSVFRSGRSPAPYGEHPSEFDLTEVEPLIDRLAATTAVSVDGPVPSQRRPRRATASVRVLLGDDPVILHAFASQTAARDFETVRGARSAIPLRTRVLETRLRRVGRFVLEADPEDRYVDAAQVIPRPWSEVRWPGVLETPGFDALAADLEETGDAGPGLSDLVRALRIAGFDVVDVGLLPPGQLRVGASDGIALTIDADRFLLYLFEGEAEAAAYAVTEPHARRFGRFVARSTPDTMYVHQFYEILYAGDDRIGWSSLLDDERFAAALRGAVGARESPEPAPGRVGVA